MFAKHKKTAVKNKAHPVDVYVGKKIRQRRTILGMSQEKLAKDLGITFQQVQKYENGANRVSSSRLYNISKIMDTTISFFFDGFEHISTPKLHAVAEDTTGLDDQDIFLKKETVQLVRTYYLIEDEKVRKNVFNMLKSMVDTHKKTQGKA